MNPWNAFHEFVADLKKDRVLMALSEQAEIVEGAFEQLLRELNTRLRTWWNEHPEQHNAIGRYYEDRDAMAQYEPRQQAAVPGRTDLLRMAIDCLGPVAYNPVLEVCSGSGAGARMLRDDGGYVVATDAFPILSVHAEQLEQAGVNVQRDLALGDLRNGDWCRHESYHTFFGTGFQGFSGILAFMGLPLIADRTHVYRGMHALLAKGGRIAVVHDPDIPGRPLPTSAKTIRDILAGLRRQGRNKSMLEVTAHLLLRRGILHDEHRLTLGDEAAQICAVFGNFRAERHEVYHEWTVFSAYKAGD